MKKYRVPVRFVFTEFVDVEGENPNDAWERAMDMDKDEVLSDERGVVPTESLDWDYNWLDSIDTNYISDFVEEIE